MKDLIRSIREHANMSQEDFAQALGTTPVSINRWENGKTKPNKMAQKQIYSFCKDRQIDLAAVILTQKTWNSPTDHIVLYHGSKEGISGQIRPISRNECDFGKGFYMGTTTLQPLTLVCGEEKPKFYTVEVDLSGLKVLSVEIDLDWALLIAYFRKEMESAKGTPIYEKYAHFADGYDMDTAPPYELNGSALPAFRAQQSKATVSPLLTACPKYQQEAVRILSSPICLFS